MLQSYNRTVPARLVVSILDIKPIKMHSFRYLTWYRHIVVFWPLIPLNDYLHLSSSKLLSQPLQSLAQTVDPVPNTGGSQVGV